jgi:hypothetical protein
MKPTTTESADASPVSTTSALSQYSSDGAGGIRRKLSK